MASPSRAARRAAERAARKNKLADVTELPHDHEHPEEGEKPRREPKPATIIRMLNAKIDEQTNTIRKIDDNRAYLLALIEDLNEELDLKDHDIEQLTERIKELEGKAEPAKKTAPAKKAAAKAPAKRAPAKKVS